MNEWKDITWPGIDNTKHPRVFCISNRDLLISITEPLYRDKPCGWYVACNQIGMKHYILQSTDLEAAKKEAIQVVYDKINRLHIMITEIKKSNEKTD